MNVNDILGSTLGLIGLFLVVLTILWALIPFAVFGIRSRMDRLITAVADLGHWQKAMLGEIKAIGKQLDKLNQGPEQPTSKSLKDQAADIRDR